MDKKQKQNIKSKNQTINPQDYKHDFIISKLLNYATIFIKCWEQKLSQYSELTGAYY